MNKKEFEHFVTILKQSEDGCIFYDNLLYRPLENFTTNNFDEIIDFLRQKYHFDDDDSSDANYGKHFPEFRWFFQYKDFKFIFSILIGQGSSLSFCCKFDKEFYFDDSKKIIISFKKTELFVGQTVYLKPTYSCPRQYENGFIETKISKIGNKYFEVENSPFKNKFEIESMMEVPERYSPNFQVYLNKEEILHENERLTLLNFIRPEVAEINKFTLEQLREIHNLLKGFKE